MKLKIYFSLFVVYLCVFLISCSSTGQQVKTNDLNKPPVVEIRKEKAFLKEIKKVQKENKIVISKEQRDSLNNAASNEAKLPEEKKPAAEPVPAAQTPQESAKRMVKSAPPSPPEPTKIDDVRIADDPEQGIIVDESVLDDFEEKYKMTAEESEYKDTEEAQIIEEISQETVPEEALDEDDKKALAEFEELKKIKDIKDLKELEELMNAELALETEESVYDIPIVINKQVEHFLDYFQGRARKIFAKWLNRSTKYLPMMRDIFEKKGLPKDLAYLAMIESGFNTSAYSRAHAVGPWQFIKGTGKKYGLRIDYWVDERRDPLKSTIAAANYLNDLHKLFDSWYLAAAAYNAGEGKIGRAIKKYNTEDFWDLSQYRYIKRETKNYIPKLLAAILISKEPAKYGFTDIQNMGQYEFDTVEITEPTDLEVIAKSAGVSLSAIKELNPELSRWYTPPEVKSYELKIPKNTKETFIANYSKLKPTEKINFLTYRIKYGETLSQVARKFGTTTSSIMKINKIKSAKRVRAGVELIIPIKGGVSVASLKKSYQPKIEKTEMILVPKGETVSYTVKSGDTLWDIAERSDLEITDIITLNKIKNSVIKPGDNLLLYKKPEKTHTTTAAVSAEDDGDYYIVKEGDSLWSIAAKFNIPLDQLLKMNKMSKSSVIKPEQKLLIAHNEASDNSVKLASSSNRKEKHITYKVKKGDTLWDIAKKHNMDISEIKALNNLKSNRIKPGDELKIKVAEI